MQMGSKENENERFKHYLDKTFKKTASLIANSCRAVCTFSTHLPRPRPAPPAPPGHTPPLTVRPLLRLSVFKRCPSW